jgi:hypothetical protein
MVSAKEMRMNISMSARGRHVLAALAAGLLAAGLTAGCASRPVVTKNLYEDRSAWIRLEINPDADGSAASARTDIVPPSSATLAALFKGFQAEKDYTPGLLSWAAGKTYYNRAFVDPELMVLTPQLAKGLAQASPKERVAYCLAVDHSATERFITTGWVYLNPPNLHFKLVEWRTPIPVKSPATPTSEACQVKPIPGVKTSDRFFKLDYAPKTLIETYGPMGASIMNGRGEVVFKLTGLDLAKLAGGDGPRREAGTAPVAAETSGQAQPAAVQIPQPEPPREAPSRRTPIRR